MYDQRLRPLTDRYETSHGLPSLETHMATVVAGWWAESGRSGSNADVEADDGVRPIVRLLAVGYICVVGFTRSVLRKVCVLEGASRQVGEGMYFAEFSRL